MRNYCWLAKVVDLQVAGGGRLYRKLGWPTDPKERKEYMKTKIVDNSLEPDLAEFLYVHLTKNIFYTLDYDNCQIYH